MLCDQCILTNYRRAQRQIVGLSELGTLVKFSEKWDPSEYKSTSISVNQVLKDLLVLR